ncbi:MAG: hypothetical protein COB23_02140 [Methylophaga sp.]|nr:MAG: hypothetical protein COB23_02140 [Methylophaga sp.]
MKLLFSHLIALLFITNANAAEPYIYTGLVNEQAADAEMIKIDHQQYTINLDTIVHGPFKRGELGPMIDAGQRVGFNLQINSAELSRISEIWILE